MKRCSIIAPAYHIAHDPCESEGEKRETRQVFLCRVRARVMFYSCLMMLRVCSRVMLCLSEMNLLFRASTFVFRPWREAIEDPREGHDPKVRRPEPSQAHSCDCMMWAE